MDWLSALVRLLVEDLFGLDMAIDDKVVSVGKGLSASEVAALLQAR